MKRLPILVGILLLLSACSYKIDKPLNYTIEPFEFINEEEQPFSLEQMKGKVWIADFIFTNCTTVCIPMMSNMASLQADLEQQKIPVSFISFSVDPENDTPIVLKEYALQFDANLENWQLLTGYSQQTIEQFAMDNFKTYAKKPEHDSQVIHGISFFLIDQNGVIQQEYNGLEFDVEQIKKDINYLVKKGQ